MYYVYVLKSLKDDRLYIGFTENLQRRFLHHQNGEVSSTAHRRPLKLVYYESYADEGDARKREVSFKKSGSVYNGLKKRITASLEK